MNLAKHILESTIEYYDSDDFKDNYAMMLLEDTHAVAQRLVENSKGWDICENREFPLSFETAQKIIEEIMDDYVEYIREYTNYYVGHDSIDSVSFGEQYLETPKEFDKETDNDCGFYVADDGLYYDMSSSGIHIVITQEDAYDILDNM